MNINGRLLLLAAVIGLFARVWTVNDRSSVRPVVRQSVTVTRTVAAPAPRIALAVTPVSERRAVEPAPRGEEQWTAADSPVSLPAGISAGTYRVVSDTGRVAILTVTEEEIADSQMPGAESELFILTVGKDRWYFIRLRSAPAALPLQAERIEEPAVETALLPEFFPDDLADDESFDADALAEETPRGDPAPVIEQSSRPRPPELPSPL